MYEVSILFDGYLGSSQRCETLKEATSLLCKWTQKGLKVLTSPSRDIEEVTFKIEKKEVIFSVAC